MTENNNETPKKSHKFRNRVVFPVAGLIVLGGVIGGASAGSHQPAPSASYSPPAATVPAPAPAPVAPAPAPDPNAGVSTLTVSGSGGGDVSLGLMAGGGYSSNTVNLPHTEQLPDGYVNVSATRSPDVSSYENGGHGNSGTVTCTITRDGHVIDTRSASGQFANVTCSKDF
jgi:hypothetical protein